MIPNQSAARTRRTRFQLYLLAHMRAHLLVRQPLRRLRVTPQQMRSAAELVVDAGFASPGHPAALYLHWCGEPAVTQRSGLLDAIGAGPAENEMFAGSRRHGFALELWPHLHFAVWEHPAGWAFDPGFVQPDGHPVPVTDSGDLLPWRVVRQDVEAGVGSGRLVEGWTHSADTIHRFEGHGPDLPVAYRLGFDFDLLQSVWPDPGDQEKGTICDE